MNDRSRIFRSTCHCMARLSFGRKMSWATEGRLLKDMPVSLRRMYIALRMLTIALQHAFVTDLGWHFERHIADGSRADLREVAAQLPD